MMEFDIVDVMQEAAKTANQAMRQRVPEPTLPSPNSVDEAEPLPTKSTTKPKTRLEKLLEEYQQQDTETETETEITQPVANGQPSNESKRSQYMLSKMEFRGKGGKRPSETTQPEMDLVVDMSDIDRLDDGKPWFRLDNWTKKAKLKQYAEERSLADGLPVGDTVQELLDLYAQGKFRKQSEVVYDTVTNRIISLEKQ